MGKKSSFVRWGLFLFNGGHGRHFRLCDFVVLGLGHAGSTLAGKNGLAILVELELFHHYLGGVDANFDSSAWRNECLVEG